MSNIQGLSFGSMFADEAGIAVVIGAPNVYVAIGGGCSPGPVPFDSFTFLPATSQLSTVIPGTYLAIWSMSPTTAAGVVQEVSGCIMIGPAPQLYTSNHAFTNGPGGSRICCIAGSGIILLARSALVTLCVANHTGANNISIEHVNLSLLRLI